MQFQSNRRSFVALAGICVWLVASTAWAQFKVEDFQLVPELSNVSSGPPDPQLKVSAEVQAAADAKIGMLKVSLSMAPDWHVYSLTQPPGGPQKCGTGPPTVANGAIASTKRIDPSGSACRKCPSAKHRTDGETTPNSGRSPPPCKA